MAHQVKRQHGSSAGCPAPETCPPRGGFPAAREGVVARLADVALGTANSLSNVLGSAYGPLVPSIGEPL